MAGTSRRSFHTASDAEIKDGEVCDVYFARAGSRSTGEGRCSGAPSRSR